MSPEVQTSSQRLLERARQLIPGASQTLSKGPSQWVQGAPGFIERGVGCRVWGLEGRNYLDLPSALGPVILGYDFPDVTDAIENQLAHSGITFSLPHRLEVEVAERINRMVPNAEQVRFMKSGSDVTSAAVRLARIHTGRDHVISSGYHGWHDWYMATSEWPKGVPDSVRRLTHQVPTQDLDRLERELRLRSTACVIIEPDTWGEDLQELVDLAHRYGALAVFDEVLTGFRLAPGGAQEYFGVDADLACFGKALGNGMPISALTGPERIMRDVMFLSGTHAGETLSLAAARATLDVIASELVCHHLWKMGTRLREGILGAIFDCDLGEVVKCVGLPPRLIVRFEESGPKLFMKSLVQQEMVREGVLFNGANHPMYAWTGGDVDKAIGAYRKAFGVLAEALPDGVEERLEGEPISPVFWER